MEQFNDLFETNMASEPEAAPEQAFDKEAYAEFKQQERQELFDTAEAKLREITTDPAALNKYLALQGRLGYSTLTTTLLVMDRKPNATQIRDYDGWQQMGRTPRKNTGIKIFEAHGEYRRSDGAMATNYDVKRVFDVSDTYGRAVYRRKQPHVRELLKALTTNMPVPIKLSGTMDEHKIAEYSPNDNVIYVARNVDGQALFRSIALEIGRAMQPGETQNRDSFIAGYSAQILCARYQIPTNELTDIPPEVTDMSADDKREFMSSVRRTAVDTMERIDGNLQAERVKQRTEQDRGAR